MSTVIARKRIRRGTWPQDRLSVLRTLWDDGVPTQAIGKELGVTKNAVIGQVHRLGLPKRGNPSVRDRTTPGRCIMLVPCADSPSGMMQCENVATTDDGLLCAVHAALCTPFAELGPRQCRFPIFNAIIPNPHEHLPPAVGGKHMLCCGAPTWGDHPYCKEHYRALYVPSPKVVYPGGE